MTLALIVTSVSLPSLVSVLVVAVSVAALVVALVAHRTARRLFCGLVIAGTLGGARALDAPKPTVPIYCPCSPFFCVVIPTCVPVSRR